MTQFQVGNLTVSLTLQLPVVPRTSTVANVVERIEAFVEECRSAGAIVTIDGPATAQVQAILEDLRVKLAATDASDEERRELEDRIREAEGVNRFRRTFLEQPERAN